jgi:hypothetical protein
MYASENKLIFFVLIAVIVPTLSFEFVQSQQNSFQKCCSLGKTSSSSCNDFSRLGDKSPTCKFAYTTCCTQNKQNNKRVNECDVGKRQALAAQRCDDLHSSSERDAVC